MLPFLGVLKGFPLGLGLVKFAKNLSIYYQFSIVLPTGIPFVWVGNFGQWAFIGQA